MVLLLMDKHYQLQQQRGTLVKWQKHEFIVRIKDKALLKTNERETCFLC